MVYEASFMTTGTLTHSLKKLKNNGRPDVEIKLVEHNVEDHTYTTGDSLSGTVSITTSGNTRFDEIQITLEGVADTFIDLISPVAHQSRQHAAHRFLNLTMPIADSAYPVPRIAEAGITYSFPFHFVVPQQLLLSSCTHKCIGEEHHVREAHLRLPPTMMGNQTKKDDLAPDMARVRYNIRVHVTRVREQDNRLVTVVDKARRIRIIPAIPESPPLHITENDAEYVLSVSKILKKGVFKGKLGTLSLETTQTKAITTPRCLSESAPTILANLNLRFDPASGDIKPPRLGSLSSKIRASTFFSIRPVADLPTRPNALSQYEIHRRVYTESVTLASRCVESTEWNYHPPTSPRSLAVPEYSTHARRDSGYSSSGSSTIVHSTGSGSGPGLSSGHYTAQIPIPLSLPTTKAWLPTFHTCILSRIYSLDMTLTAHTPGTGVPSTSLAVKLPVEIISDTSADTSLQEVGGVAAGVDADLEPRVLEAINPEFVGRSSSVVAGSTILPTASLSSPTPAPPRASVSGAVPAYVSVPISVAAVPEPDLPPGYEMFVRGPMFSRS